MSLLAVNGSFYNISSNIGRPPIMWPLHNNGKFLLLSGGPGGFSTNPGATAAWGTPFVVNSGDAHATFIAGFALVPSAPSGGADFEYTVAGMSSDGGSTFPMTLTLYRTAGLFGLRVKSGSTVICDTGTGVISMSLRYFVEWKAPTSGTHEIWINEVQRATGSGGPGGTWNAFDFSTTVTGGGGYQLDDVYLNNGAGSSPLNGILGDVVIAVVGPSADTATKQWTASGDTTNHWKNLNYDQFDGRTLSDSTLGHREIFDTQAAPPEPSTNFFASPPSETYTSGKLVYAVVSEVRAKVTDLPRKLKYGIRVSSTDDLATQQLTTTMVNYWHVHPLAPDGSSWDTTKLDALQLVLETGDNNP